MFFHWFLEKVEGREGGGCLLDTPWLEARIEPATQDRHDIDRELNPRSFGAWADTPTIEPHQPEHIFIFLIVSFEEQDSTFD